MIDKFVLQDGKQTYIAERELDPGVPKSKDIAWTLLVGKKKYYIYQIQYPDRLQEKTHPRYFPGVQFIGADDIKGPADFKDGIIEYIALTKGKTRYDILVNYNSFKNRPRYLTEKITNVVQMDK